MDQPPYFKLLLSVIRRPAMYGVQDVHDLNAFFIGFSLGGHHPELLHLLNDLTEFIKNENPEFAESTAGWAHFIKGMSWERGGSIDLFRLTLGHMLLEQGHWSDDHFQTFTANPLQPEDVWNALPAPQHEEP